MLEIATEVKKYCIKVIYDASDNHLAEYSSCLQLNRIDHFHGRIVFLNYDW